MMMMMTRMMMMMIIMIMVMPILILQATFRVLLPNTIISRCGGRRGRGQNSGTGKLSFGVSFWLGHCEPKKMSQNSRSKRLARVGLPSLARDQPSHADPLPKWAPLLLGPMWDRQIDKIIIIITVIVILTIIYKFLSFLSLFPSLFLSVSLTNTAKKCRQVAFASRPSPTRKRIRS